MALPMKKCCFPLAFKTWYAKACFGVGFTLEPESGFRDIIHLAGVWRLGENIVQSTVPPDKYDIFKHLAALFKRAFAKIENIETARKIVQNGFMFFIRKKILFATIHFYT